MVKGEVHNFSRGSIPRNIMSLALPMTAAQLINVLYSVVDRVYLGRLPGHLALTGLGLTIPIVSIIMGFANLCGTGGAPLCSIKRGQGDNEEAERVLGNAFTLLLIFGAAVTAVFLLVQAAVALPVRRKRRHLSLCRRVHDHLSSGNDLCDDRPGDESLHHGPGVWRGGYDDGGAGSRGQHRAGPHLYLWAGDGGAGRGPGDCDRPGVLRSVGAALPYRAAGYSAAEGAEYGAVCPTGEDPS